LPEAERCQPSNRILLNESATILSPDDFKHELAVDERIDATIDRAIKRLIQTKSMKQILDLPQMRSLINPKKSKAVSATDRQQLSTLKTARADSARDICGSNSAQKCYGRTLGAAEIFLRRRELERLDLGGWRFPPGRPGPFLEANSANDSTRCCRKYQNLDADGALMLKLDQAGARGTALGETSHRDRIGKGPLPQSISLPRSQLGSSCS
jgi:hypothetical protein